MPVKRFGARYGRKLKKKFAHIESQHRSKHKCPYCNKVGVKRIVFGIWQCKKCNTKFAARAYNLKV